MNIRGGLESLRQRSFVGWLRERDIDLLLCAELHAASPLRTTMAAIWTDRRPIFEGAWISHTEFDGESDLVVQFRDAQGDLVLLVENKIAADFQPDQAARYRSRAERWREVSNADVRTVLVCPRDYLSRPSTEHFDACLAYEDIVDGLARSTDARSRFLAKALADGIKAYRQGYVAVPDERATGIWAAIWNVARSETPDLNMPRPDKKPRQSTWIYFRDAKGFGETDRKRCVVVLKAGRGKADLQFSAMSPGELERVVHGLLEPDMVVAKATKSASIRISVPVVDFGRPATGQVEAIREGLQQAERLRRFYVENRIGHRL